MHAPTTLRDVLLDAEQARRSVTVNLLGMTASGAVDDVGIDHVTLVTDSGTVDLALFWIQAVRVTAVSH